MNQKREVMNIEDYREYCLSVKGATECMPFDKHTLVFKVMDKMFSFATFGRGSYKEVTQEKTRGIQEYDLGFGK